MHSGLPAIHEHICLKLAIPLVYFEVLIINNNISSCLIVPIFYDPNQYIHSKQCIFIPALEKQMFMLVLRAISDIMKSHNFPTILFKYHNKPSIFLSF
jgi:hypothetical protein